MLLYVLNKKLMFSVVFLEAQKWNAIFQEI